MKVAQSGRKLRLGGSVAAAASVAASISVAPAAAGSAAAKEAAATDEARLAGRAFVMIGRPVCCSAIGSIPPPVPRPAGGKRSNKQDCSQASDNQEDGRAHSTVTDFARFRG